MKRPDPNATLTDGHGTPIRPVDTPPAEPAGQPGYGPNPTAQGVRGYRDLPDDDVALINAVKELEEGVADVWTAIFFRNGTDRRWANVAKTHLQEGISALVRSVARPSDPFAAASGRMARDFEERTRQAQAGPQESTKESDSAQPSQDHRPNEGNRR
jgi:hypothetical protein